MFIMRRRKTSTSMISALDIELWAWVNVHIWTQPVLLAVKPWVFFKQALFDRSGAARMRMLIGT